ESRDFRRAFQKMAVERLKNCASVTEMADELRIHRTMLYRWRNQLEPVDDGNGPPASSRERGLKTEVKQLKQVPRRRRWRCIYKESRLDVGAAAALARRRLRPNPGSDAIRNCLSRGVHPNLL
ncbi:MAG TPA: transposase, partial [Acidobacteriota bacterium]|nr:transposase [Acidobacteriota bacterium]